MSASSRLPYHGTLAPSNRRNLPLSSLVAVVITLMMPATLCSGVRTAPSPPISATKCQRCSNAERRCEHEIRTRLDPPRAQRDKRDVRPLDLLLNDLHTQSSSAPHYTFAKRAHANLQACSAQPWRSGTTRDARIPAGSARRSRCCPPCSRCAAPSSLGPLRGRGARLARGARGRQRSSARA